MRAFLERLSFPWLSYNDYSITAPKQMPVLLIETLNGQPWREAHWEEDLQKAFEAGLQMANA